MPCINQENKKMTQFKVINRTTREEQIFNSKEFQRFFHSQYDPQTKKMKYNNQLGDYAFSVVKQPDWAEVLGFSFGGVAIVILVTNIVSQWI